MILSEETSAQSAAQAMRDNHIGCVLVMNEQKTINGIVTDRDFACRWAAEGTDENIPISRIMTTELLKADENSSLDEVVTLMENHGVRRIPIVSRDHHAREKVVGIITLDDLIAAGMVAPNHLAQIVKRQIGRRFAILSKFPPGPRSHRRAEAQMEQTAHRFYDSLTRKTGLHPDTAPPVLLFLLESLLMRVSATAGAHFISQLPKLIQEQLLTVTPGPDRKVTVDWVIAELISRYRLTEEFSRSILVHFLGGIQDWVDVGQIHHLKAQLPDDLKALFPPEPVPASEEEHLQIERAREPLTFRSRTFLDGTQIPTQHTGEGSDFSPPLEWSHIPVGTQEFVILCEDPDPTFETCWTHWMVYGISPTVTSLPEAIQKASELALPVRLKQGQNSWGNIGYQGPMPPIAHPEHRYIFRLFALDRPTILHGGATRSQIATQIRGHILAEAQFSGKYQASQTLPAGPTGPTLMPRRTA